MEYFWLIFSDCLVLLWLYGFSKWSIFWRIMLLQIFLFTLYFSDKTVSSIFYICTWFNGS